MLIFYLIFFFKYNANFFSLNFILQFAPFKESKKTLVARARELGLEDPAIKLLSSKEKISIHSLINPEIDGLQDLDSIELGLQHVVASIIGKDPDNVAQMESLYVIF